MLMGLPTVSGEKRTGVEVTVIGLSGERKSLFAFLEQSGSNCDQLGTEERGFRCDVQRNKGRDGDAGAGQKERRSGCVHDWREKKK